MTVEEIYSKVACHMVKGMMIHSRLADYYQFINLDGYACCHDYHFLIESKAYRKLSAWYMKNHNKLIEEKAIEIPTVVPESWYSYTKQDIDGATVKSAVKSGLEMWVAWEKETKELYEGLYKELLDIGEISDTIILKELVSDVTCELAKAEKYKLNKEFTNYDIGSILSEQDKKKEKYKHKIEEIR